MRLLVVDTETTGLDPETDHLIEFAAAFYAVEERVALWSASAIVPTTNHNSIPEINGITDGMLDVPWSCGDALNALTDIIPHVGVTAICAHKAEFDRSFLDPFDVLPAGTPWVCTREDIAYPKAHGSFALAHLAVDHGLTFGAQRHRALADVLLLCDLLACVDDLEEQVKEALKPRALFQSLQPFAQNQIAKDCGFRWNEETKRWLRKMPRDTALEPTADRPFHIRKIEDC